MHGPLPRFLASLTRSITLCYLRPPGTVFPINEMKTYRGSRGIAPLILNLGTILRWVVTSRPGLFTHRTGPRYLWMWAGWATEPVWKFWRRQQSFAPTTNRTADGPACSIVTTDYATPAPYQITSSPPPPLHVNQGALAGIRTKSGLVCKSVWSSMTS
jgi:hypothetical protein